MNLSVSPLLATFAAPCTDHCRCSLRAVAQRRRAASTYVGVVLLGVAARGRPLGEVRGPAAGVLGRGVRVLVELEHARDRAVEERAVVRHDHRAAGEVVVQEALEPVEAGEVEVVGRLVEQEHVEAGEQDRGEVRARRLAARRAPASRGRARARGGRGRRAPRRCARRSRPRRARGTRSSASAYASSAPAAPLGERVARARRARARPRPRRCGGRGTRARSRRRGARAPAGGSRRSRSAACA